MAATRHERLSALRRQIINHFDTEELKLVAFELAVNWDDLSGDKISTKTHALILLLERQNRLDDLLAILAKERPQVTWVKMPASQSTTEILSIGPDSVRTAVWNALYRSLWTKKTFLNSHRGKPPLIDRFSIAFWADYLNKPIDSRPQEPQKILNEIRHYYFACDDSEFFHFLEFILNFWNELNHYSPDLINRAVNKALKSEKSGLQYVVTYRYHRFESGSIQAVDE